MSTTERERAARLPLLLSWATICCRFACARAADDDDADAGLLASLFRNGRSDTVAFWERPSADDEWHEYQVPVAVWTWTLANPSVVFYGVVLPSMCAILFVCCLHKLLSWLTRLLVKLLIYAVPTAVVVVAMYLYTKSAT